MINSLAIAEASCSFFRVEVSVPLCGLRRLRASRRTILQTEAVMTELCATSLCILNDDHGRSWLMILGFSTGPMLWLFHSVIASSEIKALMTVGFLP